ncbi:MAG: C45 family peptidase [Spirochaetes bacterium]|nr:C45 family peptidase [Spirochaetota bacterium]
MKIIKIKGDPYERGIQYGTECKKEIEEAISTFHLVGGFALSTGYREGFPKIIPLLKTFFTYKRKTEKLHSIAKNYEKKIQDFYPDSLEEMKGIAAGAKVDYNDILYLNIFPEVVEGCSAWIASGNATKDGKTWIGMNTDAFKPNQKAQIILYKESASNFIYMGTALAGIIAPHHGINEKGLSIAYMSLLAKHLEKRVFGVPAYLIVAKLFAECANLKEALKEIDRISFSSAPSAIFFADKKEAARVEIAACQYDSKIIVNGADGCCMRPSLEKIKKYESTFDVNPWMTVNAIPRTVRMEQLLKKHNGIIDKNIMMEIAKDHGEGDTKGKSICQHSKSPMGGVTIGSFIADPNELKIWVTHNNPCAQDYKEFCILSM